jgi:hypothetical protein
MTFESYGIKDGDAIVALPVGESTSICATSLWLNATRDSESFNESVRWMLDPRTSIEAARLRDLHYIHCEGRRGDGWNRRCSAYIRATAAGGAGRTGETVTSYENGDRPSTDALPTLWDASEITD